MKRWMMVSDLDGTLLGDDAALHRFAEWRRTRGDAVRLVYASGRLDESVVDAVNSTGLPEPDAVISGVGTAIRILAPGAAPVPWPVVADGRWDAARVRQALAGVRALRIQPDEFQSDFKVSYYREAATDADLAEIDRLLASAGLATQVIYSSQRDLDVLPGGVCKGTAAMALARAWGFDPRGVVASGDTENDLSLFEQGFRGIVVANATPGLKARARGAYLAQQPCAAGVLEGLEYWGV